MDALLTFGPAPNDSIIASPGGYSKFTVSCATAKGRFWTSVWMAPTYSPTIPMNSSWTEPRKNRPITSGAIPTEKRSHISSL